MTDTVHTDTEFDPLDPDLALPDAASGGRTELFWSALKSLRATCPVAHTGAHGGLWILTRHQDVVRAAQDWHTFSSADGVAPVPFAHGDFDFRLLPLEFDPPYHRSVRKLLNPFFTPDAVERLEGDVRLMANEIIDTFAERGSCEFMSDFAVPFPAHVLFRGILGLPLDDVGRLRKQVDRLVMEPDAAHEVMAELMPWCVEVLQARREQPGGDGLLDIITHELVDGTRPLDDLEQVEALVLLIIGGLETTSIALGNIARHLAADPALCDQLRNSGDLARACDEFLRFEAPAPGMGRTATRDVEVGGQCIHQGDRLIVYYGAANRDPEVWADPDTIDLDRADSGRHLAFGAGPHRCLGSHLARLELRIAVGELLRRLPHLRLDPGHTLTWRNAFSRGPLTLPLEFTPPTPPAAKSPEWRLLVDQDRCQGHAQCRRVAPGLIGLNEEGRAQLLVEVIQSTSDLEAATAAVRNCPEGALTVAPNPKP